MATTSYPSFRSAITVIFLAIECGQTVSGAVVECLVANENVASSSLVSRLKQKQPAPFGAGCFLCR